MKGSGSGCGFSGFLFRGGGGLFVGEQLEGAGDVGRWLRSGGQVICVGAVTHFVGDPVDGVGGSLPLVRVGSFGHVADLLFLIADLLLFSGAVQDDAVAALETAKVRGQRR